MESPGVEAPTVVPERGRNRPCVRWSLGSLLAFLALNAFGGGWYGLAGAEGIPTEWLAGSPFTSYLVPSLILLVVVGGSFLAAAVAVFARSRYARWLAFSAGVIVLGWIAVQVAIIGYVSWMQPAIAVTGVVVLALAGLLPAAEHPGPTTGNQGRAGRPVS